jgi:hypothetical protein
MGIRPRGRKVVTIETQRSGLRCKKCSAAFFAELPVGVPIKVWTAAIQCTRCPACNAGYKHLGFGMSLSEDEDRSRRNEGGTIEQRANDWLLNGETGLSSETICRFMLGKHNADPSHPYDPSDLRRCILLLDRIPEWQPRMAEMQAVPGWERLALEWERVVSLLREECPDFKGSAPKTYDLIKQLTEYRDAA